MPVMLLAASDINGGFSNTNFIEPLLEGPEGVCLNGGFAYADFSAGGDPMTDRYIWSITDATGFEIFYESGGGASSEISFPFTSTGQFSVSLRVIRGGNQNYYQESQTVTVERGPSFVLPPDVVYCGSEPVMLQALDPVEANSGRYTIEWLNPSNTVIGTGNTYLATEPGRYYAKVSSVACEAVATTFVGPSISVNVVPSASVACLGSTVNYRPDAPYLATWYYQKNGSPGKTFVETAYELALDTDELDGVGAYTIYFSIEDPERPGCSVEYSYELEVRNAPDFTVTKLNDAESCQSPTGVFEIQANSPLNSVRIAGGEEVIINQMAAGEKRTITGLEPTIYTITASAGTCEGTRSIGIENENPAAGIDFEVTSVPSTCSNTGLASGFLFLDFMGLSVSGTYRIAGENGRIFQGNFQNETRVEVEVPNGSYTVSVSDENDCSSTKSQTYRMTGAGQVSFSVPGELNVCQRYFLAPDTGLALSFQMLAPDGSEVALEEGGFPIDQTGTYRLTGRPEDAASALCPRTRLIQVTVNEPLEYDVNQRIINCFGNQLFGVELFGKNPNEVIIRWMTEDRTILARELEFFPPSTGNFLLEVQPRASSACPVAPIAFEVIIPENNASAFIEGTPVCGQGAVSLLKAEVTGETVAKVEWYKVDDNGDNTWLFEYDDQLEIAVDEPGVYELVLRNEINCRLYVVVYEVEEIIPEPIDLANSYTLCSAEDRRPTLFPGDFETYAWYLEDSLLSESASYMPFSSGNYRLEVVDAFGCPQEQAFSVEENCVILTRYPNALVPGDPQREFTVYAAPEIDRVEVFIYNRNGALIFYCEELNAGQASPVCSWNGFLNGKKVMDGTYSVIVNYSSGALGIDKSEKRALTVIGN